MTTEKRLHAVSSALLALTAASVACAPAHTFTPYRQPSLQAVELRWPQLPSSGREPPVLIDGPWFRDGLEIRDITEGVYLAFPESARRRRRHPVRIMSQETVAEPYDSPTTLWNGVEFDVILNTHSPYWSQYAYQLSHEMCHVLIDSPAIDESLERTIRPNLQNQWVGEMLCELASFYVLPELERTWTNHPPFTGAATYAHNFGEYIAVQQSDTTAMIPPQTFHQWISANAGYLETHPYDRPKNAAVAIRLLPLFRSHPGMWACVTWLNANVSVGERASIQSMLAGWKARSPDYCGDDINDFAAVLGVTL